jgi:hypothetical protein
MPLIHLPSILLIALPKTVAAPPVLGHNKCVLKLEKRRAEKYQ